MRCASWMLSVDHAWRWKYFLLHNNNITQAYIRHSSYNCFLWCFL
jgi:hypothetical protein